MVLLFQSAFALDCAVPDEDGDGRDAVACGGDDCHDLDPLVQPSAPERCNGVDDDCDGAIDQGLGDADRDGFGLPGACGADPLRPDCDDTDAAVYPSFNREDPRTPADDDCDGVTNEVDAYQDDDGDGFPEAQDPEGPAGPFESVGVCGPDPDGDPSRSPARTPFELAPDGVENDCDDRTNPEGALDHDGDGASPDGGDCDDRDPDRHPGADERSNGFDDDCDGLLPVEEWPLAHPELAPAATNCAVEVCNGLDDDCDGAVDEDFDLDRDGVSTCATVPDCDDTTAHVHPGHVEWCGDGLDSDCRGDSDGAENDVDADGDGWTVCGGDAADDDATRHPSAAERCDGTDDDLDGQVDEDLDRDGDGWLPCAGDCDDADPLVSPDAAEVCNGVDDDCDGQVDADDDGAVSEPEVCAGGLDEDCDGRVDEEDDDCAAPTTDSDPTEPTGPPSPSALPRAWFCDTSTPAAAPWAWLLALVAWYRRRSS